VLRRQAPRAVPKEAADIEHCRTGWLMPPGNDEERHVNQLLKAVFVSCAVLTLMAPAHAQSTGAAEFKTSLMPAPGNWYSPTSNFGGITFDLSSSLDNPIGFGAWEYQENGVSQTVFFQGDIQFASDAEYRGTGIYATLESPTFTFSGRGDYSNPQFLGGGTAVMTGRRIGIEFHSSREANFIDNPRQADERQLPIIATLRGLPLVAPEDYSGEWMAAARYVIGDAFHRVGELKLTLTSHDLGTVQVIGEPASGPALPLPGTQSRVYSVACSELKGFNDPLRLDGCELFRAAASECNPFADFGELGCLPGGLDNPRTLVWVNPDETGSMANVTDMSDGVTTFYWLSSSFPRTFASRDRIVIRTFGPNQFAEGDYLREIILFRLPSNFYPDAAP